MEEKNFTTILGNQIEWHTDPEDMPPCGIRDSIIVAYAYKRGNGNDSIADRLYFDTQSIYLRSDRSTYFVAWAYIDNSVPNEIMRQIIEKRKQYEIDHADEIKANRIAELEAELAELKKESL